MIPFAGASAASASSLRDLHAPVGGPARDRTACKVQREICELFVQAHRLEGWTVVPERFDDEGFSGGTGDRPELERLLRMVEAGEIDHVVTYRLDRITRSVRDWTRLVECFQRHNVGLSLATGEMGEPELATGDFMLNLLAAFAEFERDIISERLRDVKAARRARGLRTGGLVPFGFKANPGTRQLEPAPDEAGFVNELFERAATGSKPGDLAAWLDARGVTTKRTGRVGGERWSARAVLRVLRNRVCLGEIGGLPAAHSGLVEKALFDKANEAVTDRQTRRPCRRARWTDEESDPFVLRGLVRCIRCGHLMTTSRGKRRRGKRIVPRYYRCRGLNACRGTQALAENIESRVLKWLKEPANAESADAEFVLTTLNPLWPVLFPQVVRSAVQSLVLEVRWDARHNRVAVVLDERAVQEKAAVFRAPPAAVTTRK